MYTQQFLWEGFAPTNSVKLLLKVKCCFKTSRRFVKLLSLSVPDTSGLYSVHEIPFYEFRFFLIVVSVTGCFADAFADGTPHLRAMLVHAFSSGIEINCNLTRQQGNCILLRWNHRLLCLCKPLLILFVFSVMLYIFL